MPCLILALDNETLQELRDNAYAELLEMTKQENVPA